MLHAEMHKCLTLLQRLERVHNILSYLCIQISGLECNTEFFCVQIVHLHLFGQSIFCGQVIDVLKEFIPILLDELASKCRPYAERCSSQVSNLPT